MREKSQRHFGSRDREPQCDIVFHAGLGRLNSGIQPAVRCGLADVRSKFVEPLGGLAIKEHPLDHQAH